MGGLPNVRSEEAVEEARHAAGHESREPREQRRERRRHRPEGQPEVVRYDEERAERDDQPRPPEVIVDRDRDGMLRERSLRDRPFPVRRSGTGR